MTIKQAKAYVRAASSSSYDHKSTSKAENDAIEGLVFFRRNLRDLLKLLRLLSKESYGR